MSHNPLKHLSILFIEDEDRIRKHLTNSLRYIVQEVKEASNGKEALEVLKHFSPDIIITDLEMPVMSGVDFIKTIRNNGLDTCVVVLTSHTNNE